MSRFVLQVLATVVLVAGGATALPNGIQLSEVFGGPHGRKYSDVELVTPGQTVQAITIRSGERVNGVGLEITSPTGEKSLLYHRGGGGEQQRWTFGAGESITGIEAHWGEKGDHTRVKYIQFTTTLNNTISGGEFITGIEAHWGEKDSHKLVKYTQFTTSAGNTISGGSPTKDISKDTAPAGFQLGGFVGICGKELDSLVAIWTSITPVA
ncbi:hypothetical protein JG688_00014815 [Phytophthora aleatoria]|uniref:Jacalin-type lectin domain-containing protein n=1 Tax=Phytophthora aleatoria TaxID=2496075 RepID=A0A8J5IBB5_9STRA|nr:hypothetical protein JG688_00014815 [Phytophthora aleatoria]